ncbi:MAG: biotin--[acetyl-CoA-carboxylase] ligase [Proteobacteria bacterium]|nr:biotin--[acetyl-CoA-carboxylase] ligase [Pseudomonadota bacterium]
MIPAAAEGWKVHTYAQLPSTQDYVKELGEEGLPEGTVVQCLTQTKGRGRHGREWTSPMGGLYMSALLRPQCAAAIAGQLSFVVAVAVSAAMDEVVKKDHKKTLKWPNDILIDGKKCAGILLESGMAGGMVNWLAAGIGVNIMSAPEGAVCLQEVGKGRQIPVHPFRDIVLSHLKAHYNHWKMQGFSDIRESWLSQAHGLGGKIKVRQPDSETEGIFKDLDKTGALVLSLSGGKEKTVNTGDVFFE